MPRPSDIPVALWRSACESIHHAIAIVDDDNKFLWANNHFVKLVGHPVVGLRKLRWMDITVSDDVETDLASLVELREGKMDRYSLVKRYRHRLGHEVPVEIVVWRFPSMPMGDELSVIVVEATPQPTTKAEVERLHNLCQERCNQILDRVLKLEESRQMAKQGGDSQIVNVGNNASDVIRWIIYGVVALIVATSYFAYIAGWPQHHGDAKPPNNVQQPE